MTLMFQIENLENVKINDFIAHASYRVTGIAATLGQAAGAAAAISAQSERLPQEIEWEEIKQKIEQVYAKDA